MDTSKQFQDVKFATESVIISLEQALRHAEAGIGRKFDQPPTAQATALKNALHETALEFSRARLKLLTALGLPTKAKFIRQPDEPAPYPTRERSHGSC